jgi:hypothetical protein
MVTIGETYQLFAPRKMQVQTLGKRIHALVRAWKRTVRTATVLRLEWPTIASNSEIVAILQYMEAHGIQVEPQISRDRRAELQALDKRDQWWAFGQELP